MIKKRIPFDLPASITPRSYQWKFLEEAQRLVKQQPENWHLFTSPTGTGKSLMELMYLSLDSESLLITPRLEIIAGMLDKLGRYVDECTDEQLTDLGMLYGIYTPIRFRNILADGRLPWYPSCLIIDEAHHSSADSYKDISMYLNGVPTIGLTATGYRGTAKSTQDFYKQWNDTVNVVLDLKTAIENGYCSLPNVELWPLVDDDIISLSNGEFKVKAADEVIFDRIKALVERCKRFYDPRQRLWDRPTMFSVPSSDTAAELTNALKLAGLPAEKVTQETPRLKRSSIFESVIHQSIALVQIDVVSEGVDLPIRRLIDIRPTMSPVRWVQQIGRIMRPVSIGEQLPEYICCCRNLERHCYLMEGLFPDSKVKEAQEMFDDETHTIEQFKQRFSKRSGTRAIGLEGLGKFTITPVQLLNGLTVFTYNLVHMKDYIRTEYFVIVHPNNPDPVIGEKVSTSDPETREMKWGKWRLIESMPELKGCNTVKVQDNLTDKQQTMWSKYAEGFGLNPHLIINTRQFQALPFLMNTGLNFRRK